MRVSVNGPSSRPCTPTRTAPAGPTRPETRRGSPTSQSHREGLVHDAHQKRQRPLKSEWHHVPLELAELRLETRLPPVRRPHPQLVITAGQIKLGEEA